MTIPMVDHAIVITHLGPGETVSEQREKWFTAWDRMRELGLADGAHVWCQREAAHPKRFNWSRNELGELVGRPNLLHSVWGRRDLGFCWEQTLSKTLTSSEERRRRREQVAA
ncbi:hypothetical protein ABZ543_13275 [Streptomyces roseifaciens]